MDALLSYTLRQVGVSPERFSGCAPDFLVVAPPKTGTTWLADNLRRHPGVFVPAIKEVAYFSAFFDALGLDWYLDHFAEGGPRLKGDATPSYALLPRDRIRLIAQLFPRLKVVFLLREPVARDWSHARHTFAYGEAAFAGRTGDIADVPAGKWLDAVNHDWVRASGDYLGQLRRWCEVFPRERVHAVFFESIIREPAETFRDVLRFLDADDEIDLATFRLGDRVLPGLAAEMPDAVREHLLRRHRGRTRDLAAFLHVNFGLTPPAEWSDVLADGPTPDEPFPDSDVALARTLDHERTLPSARRVVALDYRGFDVVVNRGRFFAVPHPAGNDRPEECAGGCAIDGGGSVAESRFAIDAHHACHEREQLLREVARWKGDAHRLETHLTEVLPGYSPLLRRARLAWHRAKSAVRRRTAPTREIGPA